jgi:hypothetical protein
MYKARHFGFRYAVKMKRGMAVLEPQSILNSGGHLSGSWPHRELWFNFCSVMNPPAMSSFIGTLALHARDVNDLQLQKKDDQMSETMISHRNLPTPMHGFSAAVRMASFPVLTGERRRPTLARAEVSAG